MKRAGSNFTELVLLGFAPLFTVWTLSADHFRAFLAGYATNTYTHNIHHRFLAVVDFKFKGVTDVYISEMFW